jgi:predicted RecB family nuclease
VAPAFGFQWRDEEPGELQSQVWLQEARSSADAAATAKAQSRIRRYNEDDLAPTASRLSSMMESR